MATGTHAEGLMAAKYKYTLDVGAKFREIVVFSAAGARVDLTGYSAKMQIRDSIGGSLLIELSTANGRILLEEDTYLNSLTNLQDSTGVITLLIPSGVSTASIPTYLDAGVYDLELTDPLGEVTRVLQGSMVFSQNVTV